MSFIGYYRYKLDNLAVGTHEISLFRNGAVAVTHTVIVSDNCSANRILKYLDKNGQYRFHAFNQYYETSDKPKLIGKTNRLITSILTAQGTEHNAGYKTTRTMSLVSDSVSDAELEFLQDLWVSPRVYLHLATDNSDEAKDWIEVTITGGDTTSKRRKITNGKLRINIELPERYSITML